MKFNIYTDGSCLGNPGNGGWAAIIIDEKDIACAIFRHGVFKKNGKQINPHAPKKVCDRLFTKGLIYGCGKPFKLIKDTSGNYITIICGYV